MSEFFHPDDFYLTANNGHKYVSDQADVWARLANAKRDEEMERLREENARLKSAMLVDENGNEYVMVCMLKEKINELKKQNERLWTNINNFTYEIVGRSHSWVMTPETAHEKPIHDSYRAIAKKYGIDPLLNPTEGQKKLSENN